MSNSSEEIDPRRVRTGLVVLAITFVVAVILLIVVDNPLGRTIMTIIVVISAVQAAMLVRRLRR